MSKHKYVKKRSLAATLAVVLIWSAVFGIGGVTVVADDYDVAPVPDFMPVTDLNNMEGKSIIGYQMWFTASPNPNSGWVHWNGSSRPRENNTVYEVGQVVSSNVTVEQWPDVSEYPDSVLQPTGFPNLPDGSAAKLFSSVRKETVDLHLSWMKNYGIDGFAIQRFFNYNSFMNNKNNPSNANNLNLADAAARENGRLFYVMYDLNYAQSSGMNAFTALKRDWINNIEQAYETSLVTLGEVNGLINSPNYAMMDGKPVVCLWGLDHNSTSYATHDAAKAFIEWLQGRGYFVIGGVPNNDFALESTDEKPNPFYDIYEMLDMISPWTVGRYKSLSEVSSWINAHTETDLQFCLDRGIEYQPVIYSGSAWANFNWGPANDFPRLAGEFLWRQAVVWKNKGVKTVYFAMFDEYDEGTAIMKGARDSYDIPTGNQYFLTYSADAQWMSSDYYLRLAGEITRLMKGEVEITTKPQIPLSEGPIYFRNSYEKRWYNLKENDTKTFLSRETAPIDPCVSSSFSIYPSLGAEYITVDLLEPVENPAMEEAIAKTGNWALRFTGSTNGEGIGSTYIITNPAKITVTENMTLQYSVKPTDEQGKYVFMDLLFDDGTTLSARQGGVKGKRGEIDTWTDVVVNIDNALVGAVIEGIIVAIDGLPTQAADFGAWIDDMILEIRDRDQANLEQLCAAADGIAANESAYVPSTVTEFEKALQDAKILLADSHPSTEDITAAINELMRTQKYLALMGCLPGDVDGNNVVNASDARLVLRHALGKFTIEGQAMRNADVQGSRMINASTARLILRYSLGKVKYFW